MNSYILTVLLLIHGYIYSQELITPFEKDKLSSTTYDECISFYKQLDETYDEVKMTEAGETDIGRPLHVVVISKDGYFTPEEARMNGKVILFINNGIHPGEPDGVDACMMFARDLVLGKENLPGNVILVIIPIYNVDGSINRNDFTRANQVGPKEYGFRGNAENRDLNRDFIKCDTKNARSFVAIFRQWKPEIFVDTHTSDGADYQYIMTYIATQHNKLEKPLAEFMLHTMIPQLEQNMKEKSFEMCPYVTTLKSTPDSGIVEFPETPRYSTGYASLFNTIGFVTETHMLKTHEQRVMSQYEFLINILKFTNSYFTVISSNKNKADKNTKSKNDFVLTWKLDSANTTPLLFKGYEAKYKPSVISGFGRLYYDRNSPYEKIIPFYNNYIPDVVITKPEAYIVPQAWWQVIELLKLNGVSMEQLSNDKSFEVESYYIESFDTRNPPYEGHYLHSNVKLRKVSKTRKFYKGDYIIYTNQQSNNFIMHVLEPQAGDSYFNWNFFDAILQQKEGFDPYVFEDIAGSMLSSKPALKDEFDRKKADDEKFRNNGEAQLKFIYDNTILEPEFMRYPVGRIVK
ncbi:MAG TPA: M14 family metallopeptidase [Ignavibacteria bacterium]|nr:M14 family metallopeptidase [Ignavibacteria bacterium]